VEGIAVGGHTMALVNASSIYYQGKSFQAATERMDSLYITLLDDTVEVRFRDHNAGTWLGPTGARVLTVAL
jgi:hypothetical protein